MRNESNLQRERIDLRASVLPLVEKTQRGDRLSASEARDLATALDAIGKIDRELLDMSDARELSEAASREIGDTSGPSADDAESRAFTRYLRTGVTGPETRSAGEATGGAGGYLVPPGWWQRLQIALKAFGGIANDYQPLETETGQPMQWATNNPTSTLATLVTENTQLTNVDYTFGQGILAAYMYANGVQLVSRQLAQDSAFDIDAFVAARCGEALGRARAAAAVNGTGSAQPLGIVTALNTGGAVAGQSGGGYVGLTAATKLNTFGPGAGTASFQQQTELASGALAPQTVAQVIGSIDPAYRKLGAKWYMCDLTLQAMRTVVDGFGRPLYSELLDDSAPKLRGYDVVVDNNIAPLTASTTSGPVFGHMPTAMVLRTVKGAGVMRLEERYADFLQVGFIGFMRFDIRSNDLRAAVTVKPAAT